MHRGSVLNMNKEQKIADLKITTCKKSLQKKVKIQISKIVYYYLGLCKTEFYLKRGIK